MSPMYKLKEAMHHYISPRSSNRNGSSSSSMYRNTYYYVHNTYPRTTSSDKNNFQLKLNCLRETHSHFSESPTTGEADSDITSGLSPCRDDVTSGFGTLDDVRRRIAYDRQTSEDISEDLESNFGTTKPRRVKLYLSESFGERNRDINNGYSKVKTL